MEKYKQIKKKTAFQDACKVLKRDPKVLPGTKGLPKDMARDLVARYKIMIIVAAINKLMNFKPEYSANSTQEKWFLRYWLKADKKRPSGFGFDDVYASYDHTVTFVGPRLSVGSRDEAYYLDKIARGLFMDMIA